ncbi:hypothetical protein ABH922_001536 [Rhodococcus sp. 27YEA15]|uniref:glycoside hydrolase family 16 protein n=1 Tax=Rhodococcus sp. 27YEA15 TaxID=3156259 RepID=UPI003C7C841D
MSSRTILRRLVRGASAAVIALCAACTVPTSTNLVAAPTAVDHCVEPSASPSGVPLPTGNLPGWKQIFTDDFNRCELGSSWSAYSGQPGGNPQGWWDESMVGVHDGKLQLRSERTSSGWISGGVSNYPVTQLYGRWEIRMRADPSDDISYHMLLWPQQDQWPPEIDFAESVSGTRDEMSAFLHWVDHGRNDKKGVSTTGDFAQWHTVGVEWGPGIVRYLLDGQVWSEAHSDLMVPDLPMWLGLQTEAGSCERREEWGFAPCSDDSSLRPDEVLVEIDWVSVYEPIWSELEAAQSAGRFAPLPSAIQFTDD